MASRTSLALQHQRQVGKTARFRIRRQHAVASIALAHRFHVQFQPGAKPRSEHASTGCPAVGTRFAARCRCYALPPVVLYSCR